MNRVVVSGIAAELSVERERQQAVEGWTQQHDDTHVGDELARAAATYALPERDVESLARMGGHIWPFQEAPKRGDRRRELIKAGALIIAEIERLDRAAGEQ